MYEVFEHTADLGLRVRAADLDRLFAEAGEALFSVIVENLDAVQPARQLSLALAEEDREYLLFDWLNELLYTFESQQVLLVEFEVHVTETGLQAVARGEPVDPERHRLDHEVKAITYHGLKLEQTADGWLAEVIIDI
jgi:SHS2 domain-containing protein